MSTHSTGEQPGPEKAASESGAVTGAESGTGAVTSAGAGGVTGAAEAGLVAGAVVAAGAAAQERQAAEGATVEGAEQGAEEEGGRGEAGEEGGEGHKHEKHHIGRIHQLEPDEHSPLAALNNVISANFRRALYASVLAFGGLGLTYISGGVLDSDGSNARVAFFAKHAGLGQIAATVGALFFLVFGVIATRTATNEILKTVPPALGDNRRNGLRWVCLLVGYAFVIFGTLGALNVPIERLLVGGAVTGVIVGIAAQQSLGNLFAGLMLLLTRPFAIGDEVSIRSGPLGGVLTGLIADMNLTYVRMVTDHGTILLPNSTLLTAAVGPPGVFDVPSK